MMGLKVEEMHVKWLCGRFIANLNHLLRPSAYTSHFFVVNEIQKLEPSSMLKVLAANQTTP